MADRGGLFNMDLILILLSFSTLLSLSTGIPTNYNVGVGIADITGPAAEVNMMGYANPAQTSEGIHLRQYSRAFVFTNPDMSNRVVYISIDACMFSVGLKLEIIKRIEAKFGSLYTERNICISGTHTHSAPGGFHQYLLYDLTSLGFVRESFDAMVDGIIVSIERADADIKPANIYINSGELLESNINRSPTAYLNNPATERAKYTHNVDTLMTVLKITDANDVPFGMLSWFAVHCTSMNNTNSLISSDNKGYASLLFEAAMNEGALLGKGPFVAAFAQSNLGDVSPNTMGPRCLDTGLPCDTNTSTCHGKNELCVAFGPGKDMFESTKIIGDNQFNKAKELFDGASVQLSGPVDFRHTYTDMTNQWVKISDTEKVKTCKPAMGYSFAAGTTDGPGAFDFTQGTTSGNPLWNFISGLLKKPSEEQKKCQQPKPILLDTGEISRPYLWQPQIVDNQILRIGQLIIIAVPAEFTTMSGRRTRDTVAQVLAQEGFPDKPIPVISGLSNDYSSYVTTYEEYQVQRYEGASTIFGPHTLQAYIQVYTNLSIALAKGKPVDKGPNPPNLISQQLSFLPPVIVDNAPLWHKFGEVVDKPHSSYAPTARVVCSFIGANPRNDRKADSTFLEVQMLRPDGVWAVQYTDANWETMFHWKMTSLLFGESKVTITWDIPANQKPGSYKIVYYGNSRSLTGTITAFSGATEPFRVGNGSMKKSYLQKKLEMKKKENMILDGKGTNGWMEKFINNRKNQKGSKTY